MKYLVIAILSLGLVACGDDEGSPDLVSIDGYQMVKNPRLSPDGKKVAVAASKDGDTFQLVTMNLDGGDRDVLVDSGLDFFSTMAWSSDGSAIYFRWDGEDALQDSGIFRVDTAGGTPEKYVDSFAAMDIDLSPDDSTLIWSTNGSPSVRYADVSNGPVESADIVQTDIEGDRARFSPDGSQIIYVSSGAGIGETSSYAFASTDTWTKTDDGPSGADYLANGDWKSNSTYIYLANDKFYESSGGGGDVINDDGFAKTALDVHESGTYVYWSNGQNGIYVVR